MNGKYTRSKTKRGYKNRRKTKNRKRGGTKPETFKKAQCAPKPKDELNKYTCYSEADLIKMKNLWIII